MSNEENLRVALQHLVNLKEHSAFYDSYIDDAIDDAFEGDPMNTWNVD